MYRALISILLIRIFTSLWPISIPFFFEPNFDALVKPLMINTGNSETTQKAVVYGDFLMKKVGNNFGISGKTKYDSDETA